MDGTAQQAHAELSDLRALRSATICAIGDGRTSRDELFQFHTPVAFPSSPASSNMLHRKGIR